MLTVMIMLPSFPILMTAQRSFAFPLRKRITVAELRTLLNPATQHGRLQLPRHAATLIAKSKFQLSRCSTGPLRHPCLTSLLSSDQTDLPSKLKPDHLIQLLAYICFSNSPSRYLVYKGISATGDCGFGGPSGTIGSSHASLTLSYAQSEIKSCGTARYQLDVQTVNFASLLTNCSSTNFAAPSFSAGKSIPDSEINSISYDQIHCHPLLVYNSGLQMPTRRGLNAVLLYLTAILTGLRPPTHVRSSCWFNSSSNQQSEFNSFRGDRYTSSFSFTASTVGNSASKHIFSSHRTGKRFS